MLCSVYYKFEEIWADTGKLCFGHFWKLWMMSYIAGSPGRHILPQQMNTVSIWGPFDECNRNLTYYMLVMNGRTGCVELFLLFSHISSSYYKLVPNDISTQFSVHKDTTYKTIKTAEIYQNCPLGPWCWSTIFNTIK